MPWPGDGACVASFHVWTPSMRSVRSNGRQSRGNIQTKPTVAALTGSSVAVHARLAAEDDDVGEDVVVAEHLDRDGAGLALRVILGAKVRGTGPCLVQHHLVPAVDRHPRPEEIQEVDVGADVRTHGRVDVEPAGGDAARVEEQVLHADVLVAALLLRINLSALLHRHVRDL